MVYPVGLRLSNFIISIYAVLKLFVWGYFSAVAAWYADVCFKSANH